MDIIKAQEFDSRMSILENVVYYNVADHRNNQLI